MAGTSIEERLSAVEQELALLRQQLAKEAPQAELHWWEQIFGTFANDEAYDDAMRLGREYRESLRPKEGEDAG